MVGSFIRCILSSNKMMTTTDKMFFFYSTDRFTKDSIACLLTDDIELTIKHVWKNMGNFMIPYFLGSQNEEQIM